MSGLISTLTLFVTLSLAARGYDLTFRAPKEESPLLVEYDVPNYDHIIYFAPTTKCESYIYLDPWQPMHLAQIYWVSFLHAICILGLGYDCFVGWAPTLQSILSHAKWAPLHKQPFLCTDVLQ